MGVVDELNMVWDFVYSHPFNRAVSFHHSPQLFDCRQVITNDLVTGHAQSSRRNGCSGTLGDIPVAEGAVQAQVLHVARMWEGNRLLRPGVVSKDHRRAQPGRYDESKRKAKAD
jgi:hypothetical protein